MKSFLDFLTDSSILFQLIGGLISLTAAVFLFSIKKPSRTAAMSSPNGAGPHSSFYFSEPALVGCRNIMNSIKMLIEKR
jgi:hypothetical protein